MKAIVDDDNIKTMVEIEREKNQQSNVKELESSSTALIPLIEMLVDKLKEEDKVSEIKDYLFIYLFQRKNKYMYIYICMYIVIEYFLYIT